MSDVLQGEEDRGSGSGSEAGKEERFVQESDKHGAISTVPV